MKTIQIIQIDEKMLIANVTMIDYEGFSAYKYDTTEGEFIKIVCTKRNGQWDDSRYGECHPKQFKILGCGDGTYVFESEEAAKNHIIKEDKKIKAEKDRIEKSIKSLPEIIENVQKIRSELVRIDMVLDNGNDEDDVVLNSKFCNSINKVEKLRSKLSIISLPISQQEIDYIWKNAQKEYNHINLPEQLYNATVNICDAYLEFLKSKQNEK